VVIILTHVIEGAEEFEVWRIQGNHPRSSPKPAQTRTTARLPAKIESWIIQNPKALPAKTDRLP
jgi:hypothetical protein